MLQPRAARSHYKVGKFIQYVNNHIFILQTIFIKFQAFMKIVNVDKILHASEFLQVPAGCMKWSRGP